MNDENPDLDLAIIDAAIHFVIIAATISLAAAFFILIGSGQ